MPRSRMPRSRSVYFHRRPVLHWENTCALALVSLLLLLGVAWRSEATPGPQLPASPRSTEAQWQRRNDQIVNAAQHGRYDVVLLGDSITQGWQFNEQIWRKHFRGVRALNAGIASDKVEQILWRSEHGLFVKNQPKVVVLLAGVNNLALATPEQITDGLARTILAIRQRSPATKFLVLKLFPAGHLAGDHRRARIRRVNAALGTLAVPGKVSVVDLGAAFLEADGALSDRTSFDYLHLTHQGYEDWARAMERPLKAMLAN